MLHAGEVLQNRYEITKIVGKGGMSTVYQARDLNNQNILAIKDVERSGKEENQEMEQKLAVSEGQMLKQLSNPHLPRIYDIIENQDSFMLVMDYIQGESLDKVIKREGPQPMERVLHWGMQICEVFHYLHNQPTPIIYRDMKPANIMLKPDGQLMMIDFGTARTMKQGVAMQADTICLGTAGFAAPEQFGGYGQSDARTDIFSLGATLYNMITGHSPSERPMGIQRLEKWNPALKDTPIAQIIYKATRQDPNERYQTAMELREDLRLAATGAFPGKGRTGSLLEGGGFLKIRPKAPGTSGGLSGGLSGLLQSGKAAQPIAEPVPTNAGANPKGEAPAASNGWQHASAIPAIEHFEHNSTEQYPHSEQDQTWHKLMQICAMIAAIFVVLAVVLLVLNIVLAAIVFLMIALGAAALAVIGVIMSRRTD